MSSRKTVSRRKVLKTGLTALGATTISSNHIFAQPKVPGETRVLAIGGDYWHNPIPYEIHWREILARTGWRLMFAQSARFITPEILKEVDLFILIRGEDPDDLGWSPDGVVEHRPHPALFMTPVQEDAIVENVHRGMGLLCMHGSTRVPSRKKFLEMIGIPEAVGHSSLQNVRLHSINQDHPITKGMKEFQIGRDQTVNNEVTEEATILFNVTGESDQRECIGAWCLERGKGRIAALLPGHLPAPRTNAQYKQMMWRAAHWALRRNIPEAEFQNGTPTKPRNYWYEIGGEPQRRR